MNSAALFSRGNGGSKSPRAVGKHPTTQIADILPSATQACPKCVTGNVLSVCAHETIKKGAPSAHTRQSILVRPFLLFCECRAGACGVTEFRDLYFTAPSLQRA
jgi:hypothetical protein